MKVYLSGRITGNPDYTQQFDKAEAELRAKGFEVVNPVRHGWHENDDYDGMIAIDLAKLSKCDAIYILDNGSEQSRGVHMELIFARYLGKFTFWEKRGDLRFVKL